MSSLMHVLCLKTVLQYMISDLTKFREFKGGIFFETHCSVLVVGLFSLELQFYMSYFFTFKVLFYKRYCGFHVIFNCSNLFK